jgi:hypothetical protein
MKINLEKLKIKREISLIINNVKNGTLDKDNTERYTKIKNKKQLKKSIHFLVNNFNDIENITITQYSTIGFIILYEIFYKKNLLLLFSENLLPPNKNRYSLNELILSNINLSRHKKYKIKREIEKLSDIDY